VTPPTIFENQLRIGALVGSLLLLLVLVLLLVAASGVDLEDLLIESSEDDDADECLSSFFSLVSVESSIPDLPKAAAPVVPLRFICGGSCGTGGTESSSNS
jgi:hypothetical protein